MFLNRISFVTVCTLVALTLHSRALAVDCNTNGTDDAAEMTVVPKIISTMPPKHGFLDISTNGAAANPFIPTDDLSTNITVPFTNSFQTDTNGWVSNNGVVHFNATTNTAFTNTALPTSTFGTGKVYYVYWDDLAATTADPPTRIYWQTLGSAPNRIFVVTWQNNLNRVGVDRSTIQLQIFENDSDGLFAQYVYKDVAWSITTVDNGLSASIGYQFSSTNGVQWSFNTALAVTSNTVLSLVNSKTGDCDTNGTLDVCEISGKDCNTNGTLDPCEWPVRFLPPVTRTNSTAMLIPDCQVAVGANSFIHVPSSGYIADANVQLSVRHSLNTNLRIVLYHDNTTVSLYGGSAAGSNQNFTGTVFDDSAATAISLTTNAAPYIGTFRPLMPLTGFLGLPENGLWRLQVADAVNGNTGTLLNWSLVLTSALLDDCNTNGTRDDCDLLAGATDANSDRVIDACQDCNTNGSPDPAEGGADCNTNSTLDVCEPDCNSNGTVDACDLIEVNTHGGSGSGLPVLIPENNTNGVNNIINVSGAGTVSDVNVQLSVQHTLNSNLRMLLIHSTTTVSLYAGSPAGQNFANTVFDQQATASISQGLAPFSFTYRAIGNLDLFDGHAVAGDWTLHVRDQLNLNTGTLLSWSLFLQSPVRADCDTDGIPDECEFLNPQQDCNTNGTLDACELVDCNTNQTLDVCDILGGTLDCNTNSRPDACDLGVELIASSGVLTPINGDTGLTGSPRTFTINNAPIAQTSVALTFNATADIDLTTEFITLNLNGTVIGTYAGTGSQCPTVSAPLVINVSDSVWNAALTAGGGNMNINMVADASVNSGTCLGTIQVDVAYNVGVSGDCNSNGTPDDCDAVGNDINTNHVPDYCEDCNTNSTPDSIESIFADCDTNGTMDVCQIDYNELDDCDTNATPDICEYEDCNTNNSYDACDILAGSAADLDCNGNARLDYCEIVPNLVSPNNNSAAAIPTLGTLLSQIPIYNFGNIRDVNVRVNIEHTLDDQLDVWLVHNGTSVTLFNDLGTSGDNFTNTVLDDEAAIAITNTAGALAPFAGTFRPQSPLSVYDNTELFGPWTLNVTDDVNGTTGTLLSWGLEISVHTTDCNTNGMLDACEGGDANSNGTLDICEDCNTNGTGDSQEPGFSDCNLNDTADFCEISLGSVTDCNSNNTPDLCEADCNTNGIGDVCEALADCNTNLVLDICEFRTVSAQVAYNGTGLPQLIPDNQAAGPGISNSVVVSGLGAVVDVNVRIDIEHTAAGDMDIYLRHGSVSCTLTDENGGTGDNFSSTVFDQAAANAVSATATSSPPYAGTFRPDSTLDLFTGNPQAGTWTLQVRDDTNGDTGTLLSWSLYLQIAEVRDCNSNGTLDVCEVSEDCNTNGTPDTCEAIDCNTNGTLDACDVLGGAPDCNSNQVPDVCELGGMQSFTVSPNMVIVDGLIGNFQGSIVNITGSGVITDVDVHINIEHTEDADLDVFLIHGNTTVELFTDVGTSGDNFTGTVLDDSAANSISLTTAALPPFNNTFRPEVPLALFNGQNKQGLWGLLVDDDLATDTGTVLSWGLVITTQSMDCNSNGSPDVCELATGDASSNGILDVCEDCNTNGTGDPLEPGFDDCNTNGTADFCDIDQPTAVDCDTNGTVDECDRLNIGTLITENATGLPLAIPENNTTGVTSSLSVTSPDSVVDVNVQLSIQHSQADDVEAFLIHGSTTVELFSDVGLTTGQNFTNTVFDDSATLSITSTLLTTPYTLTARPEGLLSTFINKPAGGTWTLMVRDDLNTDTGTLLSWSLFLLPGENRDCNTNGTLDICDIEGGAADCDTDSTPDVCEFVDCDTNGTLDTCDIGMGQPDCNSNGTPDVCDLAGEVDVSSGVLTPINGDTGATGSPRTFTISNAPQAQTSVVLTFNAIADIDGAGEIITINLNGTVIGTYGGTGAQCPTVSAPLVLNVSSAVWNAALSGGGGNMNINMVADPSLNSSTCLGQIEVHVAYNIGSTADCNTNSTPDECDAVGNDCNNNQVPDECESQLDCNTNGTQDVCESNFADCDTNGTADFCQLDCNSNGTNDRCEPGFVDCNTNNTNDSCDLINGHPDCNTNNTPDACDFGAGVLVTPYIGPMSTGNMPMHTFTSVGNANTNVIVNVDAKGDLDATTETVDVQLNNTSIGTIGGGGVGSGTSNCQSLITNLIVSPSTFNAIVAAGSGSVTVKLVPTTSVNELPTDCSTSVTGAIVTLTVGGGGDCNTNGVPDECDTDADTNGTPDICEDCNTNGTLDAMEAGYVDCNNNNVFDFCELNALTDCNTNDALDECELVSSLYQIDDGSRETAIGFTSIAADIIWLNRFDVTLGAEAIDQIQIAWALTNTALNGMPAKLLVYSDPNNDGNPADAVLLQAVDVTVSGSGTGNLVSYNIPPTVVGSAGDKFFVGAILPNTLAGGFPAAIDTSSATHLSSWFCAGTPGNGDINVLTNNTVSGVIHLIDNSGFPGNWLIRARTFVGDCNTNNSLDVCELDSGGPDCNTNGTLDECEFVDCDTNGTLDSCDILGGDLDCNSNLIPDHCELLGSATLTGPFTGPLNSSASVVFNFTNVPNAGNPVVVSLDMYGDFDGATETADVIFNGTIVGTVGGFAGPDINCDHGTPTINVPAATFNALLTGGNLTVTVDPNSNVGEFPTFCTNVPPATGVSLTIQITGGGGDCNSNGTPDDCDAALPGSDCDSNNVPDLCQPFVDCNTNGTRDACDVNYSDCNTNAAADLCELTFGTATDCNTDGVLDICNSGDCNTSGTADICEAGFKDCNTNNLLDTCEIGYSDCDTNGTHDACDMAPCYPGRLIAIDTNRQLYEVSPVTGAGTLIGTVSSNAGTLGGLAYDRINGVMYLASLGNDALYKLNINTGAATLVGSFGDAAIVMHGLEYDESTDTLYGSSSHNAGLYTINKNNGAATLVGLTGLTSFCNLGYDSNSNVMYLGNSSVDNLYTVDRTSGAVTLIGSTLPNVGGLAAMAYSPNNNTMYLLNDTTPDSLFSINLSSAVPTLIGPLGIASPFGLAVIPPFVPPACTTCTGDINGDNMVDGQDVAGWVRCLLGSPQGGDNCACQTGMTTAQFISKLLTDTNTACP